VLRRCVRSRNLKIEETVARIGPQRHKKKGLIDQFMIGIQIYYKNSDLLNELECRKCDYNIKTNEKNWEIYA